MNDIPSPLMTMLADERRNDFVRGAGKYASRHEQRAGRADTLRFPTVRRTIGLTLIRTGRVLAGAQLNGV